MVYRAPAGTRSSRRRFWRWTVFLTLCALLGLGKPIFDLHWQNGQTLYAQAVTREQATRQQVRTEIWSRLFGAYGRSPAEIEAILGLRDGLLAEVPQGERATRVIDGARLGEATRRQAKDEFFAGKWTVPIDQQLGRYAAGWAVVLNFVNGRFSGASASPPAAVRPPGTLARNAIDVIVRVALVGGPIVWFGGLLAAVVERARRGSRFAEVSLAAALAGTVAWAVHAGPDALPSVGGFIGVGVGAGGMLVAWRACRWLRRLERARDQHLCFHCGYNLTGNVSGICPECGAETYDAQRRQQAANAAIAAQSVEQVVVDVDGEGDDNDAGAAPEGVAGVTS